MTARGDLSAHTTTFTGRRTELADAAAHLGRARLVTLTGVAGVGKTRVAGELGRLAVRAGSFQHGVQEVRLSDLGDPALLARTVAAELGIVDNARDNGFGRLVES